MPISLIKDQILARPITLGGGADVQIPEDTKIPTKVCRVVDVGPGKYEDSAYVPIEVVVDDYILCGLHTGVRVLISDVEHVVIKSDDIMCKYSTT